MSNIGWVELLIIIAVFALLFLAPKKLPQLARSLGKSIRGFKKGVKEGKEEADSTAAEIKEAAGTDELRATVEEIRESADVRDVLPGKKKSGETGPRSSARKDNK